MSNTETKPQQNVDAPLYAGGVCERNTFTTVTQLESCGRYSGLDPWAVNQTLHVTSQFNKH